jgi:hypothetical protein
MGKQQLTALLTSCSVLCYLSSYVSSNYVNRHVLSIAQLPQVRREMVEKRSPAYVAIVR